MLSVDISLVPYLSLLCGSHWRKNWIKYRDRRYVSKFTIQTSGKSIERFELKHFPFLSQQLILTLSWDFSWMFFFFFFTWFHWSFKNEPIISNYGYVTLCYSFLFRSCTQTLFLPFHWFIHEKFRNAKSELFASLFLLYLSSK